ncbi:kelch repeat protein [Teladorsagia circumcincta]|uniref:Kelch repeat protein n=1 Tax=Teladorsagia circumcincta TaxID=45464 RepID=A0A2G9TTC3_TELCI|nr:kelch repeat protein [Teladorsagia circumcincta]
MTLTLHLKTVQAKQAWSPVNQNDNGQHTEKNWPPVALAAVDEELFAVGGFDGIAYLETVEIFDAKENQWRHHSRMNDRRHEAGVSAVWMRR